MDQIVRHWMPPCGASIAVPLIWLFRQPEIRQRLCDHRLLPMEFAPSSVEGYVGWGRKWLAKRAQRAAARTRKQFWTLEDGFLRSVGLGKDRAPAVSVVWDDLGIYYDAATPSRLEVLIAGGATNSAADMAAELLALVKKHRLTKYNHLPDRQVAMPRNGKKRILLADQVAGDYGISYAGGDADSFGVMANLALQEADSQVVLRTHPDIMAGRARGMLEALLANPNVHVVADAVSPHAVLDAVDEVWTVSSQLGFDALMRNIPVHCFAAPFYAGWGLTTDRPQNDVAEAAFAGAGRGVSRHLPRLCRSDPQAPGFGVRGGGPFGVMAQPHTCVARHDPRTSGDPRSADVSAQAQSHQGLLRTAGWPGYFRVCFARPYRPGIAMGTWRR
jgi:capsular polysaccharide export protein